MKLSGNEVLFCALIFLCICTHAGGALWPPLSLRCRQTGVTFYFSFILATTLTRPPRPDSLPSALLALDLCGSFLALPRSSSLFPGGGDCHSCCIFLESQAFVLAACRLTWVWVKRVRLGGLGGSAPPSQLKTDGLLPSARSHILAVFLDAFPDWALCRVTPADATVRHA